jgi:uncharacterized membrane protein
MRTTMSTADAVLSPATPAPRRLLFGSLALNLFFIGVTAALLVRAPAPPDRNIGARIERLAASLPQADGDKLRADFNTERAAVNATRLNYDKARDGIRTVLRTEPFDAAAMREAMSKARAARQDFDLVLHGVIAKAAAEMTPAGRQKLADWPPSSQR